MKKIIALFLLLYVYSLTHAQSAKQDLNGCNSTCIFSECMVSCEKGAYPSCSCILGAFASCECKTKAISAQTTPALKNADKLLESIRLLKANGLEDYASLFESLKIAMEKKEASAYYKYLHALEELVNSNTSRAFEADKWILK